MGAAADRAKIRKGGAMQDHACIPGREVVANRREFIRLGLAAPALALAGSGALPARADTASAPDLFVFDDRFAEARLLAGEAGMRGADVYGFAGDPMLLWDELAARWAHAPIVLGGVTTPYGLFVLETLAADRRMRLTHRTEIAARDGALVQWMLAPRTARGA